MLQKIAQEEETEESDVHKMTLWVCSYGNKFVVI
jgi:hypothetical protein